MIPLKEVIALLHRLEALGWPTQIAGPALILACYVLLIVIAWHIGRRNSADLKDKNAALENSTGALMIVVHDG